MAVTHQSSWKATGSRGEPRPCPEQSPPSLLLPHTQLGGHRYCSATQRTDRRNLSLQVKLVMWGDAGD